MARKGRATLTGNAGALGFKRGADVPHTKDGSTTLSYGDGLGPLGAPAVIIREDVRGALSHHDIVKRPRSSR